jgi:peroxiredoxin
MFGFKRYNYDAFTRDLLMKDAVKSKFGHGPEPGESAPGFEARTLDGEKIELSDFEGDKNVVLTFGSATCPFTAASIEGMNDLYDEYGGDDVQFFFVYAREAHPGERLGAHKSHEDKVRAAELFREQEEVDIPIIVDDVKGKIHRKYGALPNPTYIIDKSGRVAFRALWTRPSVIEDALDELLERQKERDTEHAIVHGGEDTSMPLTFAMFHAHRALDRGGRQAIDDFRRELGMPGRLAHAASRVAAPVALHPGRAIAGALIAGGVIAGGLVLGRKLRQKRFPSLRDPYQFEGVRRRQGSEGDYAVGI